MGNDEGCLVGASAIAPSVVDAVSVAASAAVTLVTASVILSVTATGAASATAALPGRFPFLLTWIHTFSELS